MQAVTFSGYGEPEDVLKLSSIPRPVPGPDEVLVKVHATAVNDWDWCYVRGQPLLYRLFFGIFRPKMEISGAEISGLIEAVGSKVQRFKVGDAVYGDISESGFGGFAEYLSVTEDSLSHKPDKMTHLQATSLSHASMLALQSLVDIGQIKSGEKLLVNGAGGGVGPGPEVPWLRLAWPVRRDHRWEVLWRSRLRERTAGRRRACRSEQAPAWVARASS